jgi:hypothetical protein
LLLGAREETVPCTSCLRYRQCSWKGAACSCT